MTRGKATVLNRTWAVGAVVLVSLLAGQPVFAQDEPAPACSTATLTGLYIFDASGFVVNVGPKAVVEFLNMNGDGTLTSVATANVNGTVIAHQVHGSGSYSVNPDCTGTLAFNPAGPHFDIYIAPLGTEFHMIQTDAGQVLAGKVTQVSRARPH
jgi:hypothetical protein